MLAHDLLGLAHSGATRGDLQDAFDGQPEAWPLLQSFLRDGLLWETTSGSTTRYQLTDKGREWLRRMGGPLVTFR